MAGSRRWKSCVCVLSTGRGLLLRGLSATLESRHISQTLPGYTAVLPEGILFAAHWLKILRRYKHDKNRYVISNGVGECNVLETHKQSIVSMCMILYYYNRYKHKYITIQLHTDIYITHFTLHMYTYNMTTLHMYTYSITFIETISYTYTHT